VYRRFLLLAGVLAALLAPAAPAAAVPTGSGLRTVLIVLVDWPASPTTPAAPPDRTTPTMFRDFVNVDMNQWYQEASYGWFGGWTASAVGWLRIPAPAMDANGTCGPTFNGDVASRGEAAALANGVTPSSYAVVMYYFSTVRPCSWAGTHLRGTNTVLINGSMTPRTVVHELGHTLGLGHGNARTCTDPAGQPVAFSATCQDIEYGDFHNAMGRMNPGNFSVIQKSDLGWLGGRQQTAGPLGGTYTLRMLETSAPGVQALRIEDGADVFWLEYRRSVGVDKVLPTWSVGGVLVHHEVPPFGSYLLDMTPGSGLGLSDAPLPLGATWFNPLGNMGVTVTMMTSTQVQLTVHSRLRLVPDVVGLPTSMAVSALGSAGLVATQTLVADPTCDDVGLVVSQSPPPGTAAPPGTAVALTIATRPPPPYRCP